MLSKSYYIIFGKVFLQYKNLFSKSKMIELKPKFKSQHCDNIISIY